ncbi:MAG: Holliday junction branch migration protein RuvA [Bacteroidota bacterium]
MYAYIEGNLVVLEATHAVVDVGGVAYHIRISLFTYSKLTREQRKTAKLYTYLQVQENAHHLFGFAEEAEKELFLALIGVSGIGANTAIVMLSSLSPEEIQQAIVGEEVKTIQSIKGIGTKTAQRVILELKDKLKKIVIVTENANATTIPHYRSVKEEALLALTTLGFPKNVAEKNIETVFKKQGSDIDLENLIKQALKL